MDEQEQRRLAQQLTKELHEVIPDAGDRTSFESELAVALRLPAEQGDLQLTSVLASRPETRAWIRSRASEVPDEVRIIELAGGQTAWLGVLFECPEGDEDFVREGVWDEVPLCSSHHVAMIRVED